MAVLTLGGRPPPASSPAEPAGAPPGRRVAPQVEPKGATREESASSRCVPPPPSLRLCVEAAVVPAPENPPAQMSATARTAVADAVLGGRADAAGENRVSGMMAPVSLCLER